MTRMVKWCLKCMLVLIAVAMVAVWAMQPRPYSYVLSNPEDRSERTKLIDSLKREQGQYANLAKSAIWSAANDPDRYYPLDRTSVVEAVNEYVMDNGRLPGSVQELCDAKLLSSNDLSNTYSLSCANRCWELWAVLADGKRYKIARGN